jgi:hypothetical protein
MQSLEALCADPQLGPDTRVVEPVSIERLQNVAVKRLIEARTAFFSRRRLS